jgi:predicted Zn-dependent protease
MGASYLSQFTNMFLGYGLGAALMGYARSQESEADHFGYQTAFAAGASHENMQKGWREFTEYIQKVYSPSESVMSRILASHPGADRRLQDFQSEKNDVSRRLGLNQQFNSEMLKELVVAHKDLYSFYHPLVQLYGEKIRKNRASKEGQLSQAYSLETLLNPGGTCVLEALGSASKPATH